MTLMPPQAASMAEKIRDPQGVDNALLQLLEILRGNPQAVGIPGAIMNLGAGTGLSDAARARRFQAPVSIQDRIKSYGAGNGMSDMDRGMYSNPAGSVRDYGAGTGMSDYDRANVNPYQLRELRQQGAGRGLSDQDLDALLRRMRAK